jgi:tripartite-type tricarboxylate transporter receptor subunit TctC
VRAGTLVALAVTDAARSAFTPNVPTMIEAGIAGFESVLWFGLVAPVDTPSPTIEKLARAANEALTSDEVANALQAQTIAPIGGTPEAFGRYMTRELERWSAVVTGAGLKK